MNELGGESLFVCIGFYNVGIFYLLLSPIVQIGQLNLPTHRQTSKRLHRHVMITVTVQLSVVYVNVCRYSVLRSFL